MPTFGLDRGREAARMRSIKEGANTNDLWEAVRTGAGKQTLDSYRGKALEAWAAQRSVTRPSAPPEGENISKLGFSSAHASPSTATSTGTGNRGFLGRRLNLSGLRQGLRPPPSIIG